ncbi:MAG: energy-coupling factor transporter transmembrane protein EcfT, partial [Anaerolineaceae bacterium]|nr:energy-coupling factor transporter transmembrane protein EcfT [Anaerolineaceae bacterium]
SLAVALMKMGIPYRYGFVLITALRLIPILQEDIKTINRAQMVRGVNFHSNLMQKLWVLPRQFLLPVLVVSMKRVDALNFSMEGRCFGKYSNRTYLQQEKFTFWDRLSLFILAGIVTLSLFC